MDAITPKDKRFIPAVADAIAEWFPELDGRAIPVSEVEITKENPPTLPLVFVAFARSEANPTTKGRSNQFIVTDAFVVEFWMKPKRYPGANGETPFWSYYDYEYIRDKLLTNILQWETPNGSLIQFRGLTMGAEPMAITLTFAFTATYRWCLPCPTDFGEPFTIGFQMCPPPSCCPEVCDPPKEDELCDPCK